MERRGTTGDTLSSLKRDFTRIKRSIVQRPIGRSTHGRGCSALMTSDPKQAEGHGGRDGIMRRRPNKTI